MNGYVYVIEKEDGIIKIGRSINIEARLRCLETQAGFNIKRKFISQECGNSNEIETYLHKVFQDYRVKGEWFNVSFDKVVTELVKSKFEPIKEKNSNELGGAFKEIIADFYFKEFDEVKTKLNLKNWTPTNEDIEKSKVDINKYIECCREDCNEPDWTDEWQEKLNILNNTKDIKAIKTIIQEYYKDMFYSYECVDLRKYIGDNDADFIEKVLGLEYYICNQLKEEYLQI